MYIGINEMITFNLQRKTQIPVKPLSKELTVKMANQERTEVYIYSLNSFTVHCNAYRCFNARNNVNSEAGWSTRIRPMAPEQSGPKNGREQPSGPENSRGFTAVLSSRTDPVLHRSARMLATVLDAYHILMRDSHLKQFLLHRNNHELVYFIHVIGILNKYQKTVQHIIKPFCCRITFIEYTFIYTLHTLMCKLYRHF